MKKIGEVDDYVKKRKQDKEVLNKLQKTAKNAKRGVKLVSVKIK